MAGVEDAIKFLQKDSGGRNLYDHLSDVLLKVLEEKPSDAVDIFEHISTQVKLSSFQAEGDGAADAAADESAKDAQRAWSASAGALFSGEYPPADEDEDPAPKTYSEDARDLAGDANLLEWGGVSFGRSETFRLHVSIKEHAGKEGVANARLWGKVLGTQADYYVMEGEADQECGDGEEGADGANKYVYYVCSHAGGAWTKLPSVSPAQICAARQLRKFFTGNLEAAVSGYPPFPGNEAGYLRAQIACISADTILSPAGYFEDDGEGNISKSEDFAGSLEALADAGGWVSSEKGLDAKYGRCTAPLVVNDDGEEVEADDFEGRAALAAVEEGSWSGRALPMTGGGATHAVVRSLNWPGAVAVASDGGSRYANVYVGYGQPFSAAAYTPPLPPVVQAEFDDSTLAEQEDVTEDPDAGEDEAAE